MSDPEKTEEPSVPRKRIAVACGRCRQRKIRCSGDNGTGAACTNCKTAGTERCQFLRVSSLVVLGGRPENISYDLPLSQSTANRHPALSPTVSSLPLPYASAMMANMGHSSEADRHEMPYGCVQRPYDQAQGWNQGFGGDHGIYSPSSSMMNEQLSMMGSYRSGLPTAARRDVLYVNADGSVYDYGTGLEYASTDIDIRSTTAPDLSSAFQSGMSRFSNNALVDHPGRCVTIPADRSRSGSSHPDALADRRSSPLGPGVQGPASMADMFGSYHGYESGSSMDHSSASLSTGPSPPCSSRSDALPDPRTSPLAAVAAEGVASLMEMNGGYRGYDSGTYSGNSIDRGGGGIYTSTPPDELLVHDGALRSSIPDYYRYGESSPERGSQTSRGSAMSLEDVHYFPPGRAGCYVDNGNGLVSPNNGVDDDGRGTPFPELR
ncbi:hypothetical protein E4U17_001180 [Claviceps sp. LM77 group G4]|nr:hypothetical protein E4U17_001180 [Claviceps sp. LM77 group G4]KAG6046892.1 hypothetical protein E4U33_001162 [Claviceps sp. LM78 group G4]KAG6081096.1 hypothetical protein E4U16_007785 [Claviceps sp. LM84 group G4]